MTPTQTFTCSICGEPSVSICVYCTKDACPNHLCERCHRCSDCCECDIRLDDHSAQETPHPFVVDAAIEEEALNGNVTVRDAPPEPAEPEPPSSTPEGSDSQQ